jgi:hypothetical protein
MSARPRWRGCRSAAPKLTKLAVSWAKGETVSWAKGANLAYATLPAGHPGKLRFADIFFVRAGLDLRAGLRAGSLIKVNV